jgi:hypothetical protein
MPLVALSRFDLRPLKSGYGQINPKRLSVDASRHLVAYIRACLELSLRR